MIVGGGVVVLGIVSGRLVIELRKFWKEGDDKRFMMDNIFFICYYLSLKEEIKNKKMNLKGWCYFSL